MWDRDVLCDLTHGSSFIKSRYPGSSSHKIGKQFRNKCSKVLDWCINACYIWFGLYKYIKTCFKKCVCVFLALFKENG